MVYKRYIKKGNKLTGPYFYKSVRQNGKVRSIYVGQTAESEKSSNTLHPLLILFILASAMAILFLAFKPMLTGYFVYVPQETYLKAIDFTANDSVIYEFELDHELFELNSLSITGTLYGDEADVYLEINDNSHLIGEFSNSQTGIAGYAISEIEETAQEEPAEIVVEQPEAPVELISETPAETAPEIQPAETVTEEPVAVINETETPQEIGDIVSDISFSETNQTEQESQENTENESPVVQARDFKDSCQETCNMQEIGIGKTNAKLKIVLKNAQLKIDSITYSIINLKDVLNMDNETLNELKENGRAKIIVDLKEQEKGMFVSASEKDVDEIKVEKTFENSNAVSGELTTEDLKQLVYNKDIEQIQFDSINTIVLADSAKIINATEAWSRQVNGINITGSGETVCVVDTGVSQHNALAGRIIENHCYCSVSGPCCANGQAEDTTANDDNSHGTHVAGTIASNDSIYRGIAPDAEIVAVKVCNSAGYCASSDMIAGVEFCVANAEIYNISVISMSIGGGSYTSYCDSTLTAMTAAINAAKEKGILVSIAAGNNGYNDRIMWPACVENATAVMATDKSDNVASYSNRNSLVDLAATGGSSSNPIISTVLNNGFAGKYGTSMATPHVSGAAVLLRQYVRLYSNMTLSPSEIEDILKRAGKQINDSSNSFYRINVMDAINSVPKINQLENSIETGNAKIKFSDATDLSSWRAFTISNNFISLNPSSYPQYNKSASITFYNLAFEKIPVILKNGIYCHECSILGYENGTLEFSINGFSNYSSSSSSELSVSDSANRTTLVNNPVNFYANYIARNSSSIINGTCLINFDNPMEMILENDSYYYTRTFSDWGDYAYNISCNSSDFEALSASSSINVTKHTTVINFTLNSRNQDISILRNTSVSIRAELIQPSNGTLTLYLNDSLINQGENSVSNITEFNDFGNFTVNASYDGTENYSSASLVLKINVINDSSSPKWSSVRGLSNVYGKNKTYQINVTWTDNVGMSDAWIENNFFGNFSNYSLSRISDEYSYSFADLAAGDYLFRLYANDSSGNLNSTSVLNLRVNKSSNPVSLYINNVKANATITYGMQSTVTANAEGDISLYKDNLITANPCSEILAARTSAYVYKANATGNQNYTDNSTGQSSALFVSKADSSISIYFNDNSGDSTASNLTVRIKAVLTTPSSGNLTILQENSEIASGSSPLNVNKTFISAGTYKINATFSGNSNYSGKSKINYITIQQVTQQNQQLKEQLEQDKITGSDEECLASWKCSEWSACMMNKKTRACYDANNCGTNLGKPTEVIDCSCKEDWKCEEWTECSEGKQTRKCSDLSKCAADKTETQFCLLAAPLQSSEMSYIIAGLEYIGNAIDYFKTNIIPVTKNQFFYPAIAIAALIAIAFIFKENAIQVSKNVIKSAEGLKVYPEIAIAELSAIVPILKENVMQFSRNAIKSAYGLKKYYPILNLKLPKREIITWVKNARNTALENLSNFQFTQKKENENEREMRNLR